MRVFISRYFGIFLNQVSNFICGIEEGEIKLAEIEREQQAESEEPGQMSLLDLMEDKPSDEGEFLKSYITDYRRVQEYGD